jgi:membrane fusion protein (multidrug efflux system)
MKKIALFAVVLVVLGATAAGLIYYMAAGDLEAGSAQAAETDSDAPEVETASNTSEEPSDAADSGEDSEGDEDEDGDAAIPVEVVGVSSGSVSTYITATANLIPEEEVQVLAEAEGRVTRLLVEEGDRVKAGQLLAALLRDEAEILYNKAQLKAANAEMAYERAERMHRENLIAQEEHDKTTMDHRIAQQELAEAEWRLDKTEIRAPFAGRVTKRNITLGQHVRPGDDLFTVTDFDPLISRIYLPEKDVLPLKEGREVDITLKADDSVRFRGRIRQISPVVDTATGTVKVTVAAIDPPAIVRPGGFVTIDIVRATHANTLMLPRDAVIRELQRAHVFVVQDDVAEKRSVTLGLEEKDKLEILDGVEAREMVVVAGQGGLKDGSRIKILPEDSENQASTQDISTSRLNG